MPRSSVINWLLLISLILLWGTSFMFIAISVESIDPITVVFSRLIIGALILIVTVYAKGLRLPFTIKAWLVFFTLGAVGSALPFFLITWGELWVDSGIAGMIMAVMPLITMILAHYLVEGETLNRYKIIGFVFGISGVVILLGPIFEGGVKAAFGGIAVFIAAISYAVNAVLIKRLRSYGVWVSAAGALTAAMIIMFPFWLFIAPPLNIGATARSINAVIWLGIGPSAIAVIILYAIVERAGPTFLALINYMIPVVAFFAGAYILSEPVELSSFFALGIILSGIALTRFHTSKASIR